MALSIVVTPAEHQKFTNAWRGVIGYIGDKGKDIYTNTANKTDIENAAREIYKSAPKILKAMGL